MAFIDPGHLASPNRHIFLSPHYDDIPLSCGGTAARIAELGKRPEIALVFGSHIDSGHELTAFARKLHAQWGLDAAEVIDARRREEAAASALIGATDTFLPFHDAIYRGDRYTSDELLFSAPAQDEANLPRAIVDSMQIQEASADVRVYAPLAVGLHVDHQHAFLTGVLLANQGFDVWFYEDLPYALRPGHLDQRVATIDPKVRQGFQVDVSDVWATKIDAILAYPSQVGVIFEEYVGVQSTREAIDAAMREYSEQAGGGLAAERFWQLAG